MKTLLPLLLSLLLLSGLSAQESSVTYSGIAQNIQYDSLQPTELFQFQNVVYQLSSNRDSIDWLVPQLIERSEQYGEYLPRIYMLQQICTWYDNIYKDNSAALIYTNRLLEVCQEAGDSVDYYWLTNSMSFQMFLLQQSGKEDEAVLVAKRIADRLEGEEQIRPRSYGYRQLCIFYDRLEDFNRANIFCRKGISHNLEAKTSFFNNTFYQTLAIVGSKHNMSIDSVIFFRRASIVAAKNEGVERDLRTNYRNLASDYSMSANRDSAEKYFALSKATFKKYPWARGEITLALRYAEHLNRWESHERAYSIADSILPLLDSNEYNPKIQCIRIMLVSRAMRGQVDNLDYYLNQSDSLILYRFDNERLVAQEEMASKYEAEKKEAAIALLEEEKQSTQLRMIIALLVAIAAALLGYIGYRGRKKDRALAELRESKLREEREQGILRINGLKNELHRSITQGLDQQSRNIELQELVEELNTQVENRFVQSKAKIIRQKMSDAALNETLDDIEYRAKEVFPILYTMLYKRLSSRSNTELVYCIMVVMNYSMEDIRRILQRSDKAVKSLRYRIRKKLDLSDEQDLTHYLKHHTE